MDKLNIVQKNGAEWIETGISRRPDPYEGRRVTCVEITEVIDRAVRYTVSFDGGGSLSCSDWIVDFIEWYAANGTVWTHEQDDYLVDPHEAVLCFNGYEQPLTPEALGDRPNEVLRRFLESAQAAPVTEVCQVEEEVQLIRRIEIVSLRVAAKGIMIEYGLQLTNDDWVKECIEPLSTLLLWLVGDGADLAEVGYGFDPEGVRVIYEKWELNQSQMSRKTLLDLLGVEVVTCKEAVAYLDEDKLDLVMGGVCVSIGAEVYELYVDELNRWGQMPFVNGQYYLITSDTKISGIGSVMGREVHTLPVTWKALKSVVAFRD